MKNEHSILFAFGPARGGTTYLGSILNKWFDVGIGPEGTFIPDAYRMAKRLGDIENLLNRRKFADYLSKVEMLEIIRKRYPRDKSFNVSPEDILKRMRGNSAADGIFAVFKAVADYMNKSKTGNKNPEYWKYLSLLDDLFPKESLFLFIVRDGRDVALSLKDVPWGGHSAYEAALEWRQMIRAVDSFKNKIVEERLLTVRYEDLLTQPEKEIRKISKFLANDDTETTVKDFVEFSSKNEKKGNFDKWKTQMSCDEIEIYESIAGNELLRYGYERRFSSPKISFLKIVQFEIEKFLRLIRLNIYHFGRTLPQDSKKWKTSRFKSFFRPGGKER